MFNLKKIGGVVYLALVLIGCAQAQSVMNWTPAPSLLSSRDSAPAVVVGKGNIYVLGGNTNSPLSVDLLSNGAANWTAAPPLSTARIAPGAIAAPNGQIFVLGGKSNGRATKDAFYYNPANGAVSNQSSMKTLRYRFAATIWGDNLYAIGGLTGSDQPTAAAEVFLPGVNKWQAIASLPEARSNFSAVSEFLPSGASIMTFGGSIAGSAATNTVYKFDFFNPASWTALAPMPVTTRDSAVVKGANRLVYVIGGFSVAGTPLNTVQIYDIANNSWRLGTPLPIAVGAASAVINESGNLVVIGGIDSSNSNTPLVWTSPQTDAPPVISSILNNFVNVGESYSTTVIANGNPSPTYSLVTSPNGMTIDAVSGVVSWTPTLAQSGLQNMTVRASNASGFVEQSTVITTLPLTPTGLTVSNITANTANLSWNPLPADAGAVGYRIYQLVRAGSRGGIAYIFVGETASTSFAVNNLVAGTSNRFAVTSVVNGLESQKSLVNPSVIFVTLQPSAPTGITIAAQTQSSVTFSWTAADNNPLPIAGYRIYEFDSTVSQTVVRVDNITSTSATVNGLLPNTIHQFYVVAYDAAFNQSVFVLAPVVTTSSLPSLFHTPAFIRPLAYGGGYFPETVAAVNGDRLMLISTDAHTSAIVDYVVSTTGVPRATFSMVSGPAGMTVDPVTGVVLWTNISAAVGTYTAVVRGTNIEGSTDFSFSYTVYAAGTDVLSPTEPLYFMTTTTNITRTSATINWAASTDNVGVVGYRVYVSTTIPTCTRNGICTIPPTNITPTAVVNGTTTSVTVNNLTPNTIYGIWVVAFDAAGNTSFLTAAVRPGFVTLP
jgi:Fibronectin type III domain/Kelch motif